MNSPYLFVNALHLPVKQQTSHWWCMAILFQAFSPIKLRLFLNIDCHLTIRSASIQSTADKKKKKKIYSIQNSWFCHYMEENICCYYCFFATFILKINKCSLCSAGFNVAQLNGGMWTPPVLLHRDAAVQCQRDCELPDCSQLPADGARGGEMQRSPEPVHAASESQPNCEYSSLKHWSLLQRPYFLLMK